MTNKLEAIKDGIQKAFPGSQIIYREKKFELHKFRIDRERLPSYWLYFTWEYIEDHSANEVLDGLRKSNVSEILLSTNKPKWLAIGDFGVKEVDDSYGHGR
jgi:hypothetical protein